MATQIERRQQTRDAIIAAATTLFGDKGFGATTMDEIAAAAGVAKGAVYHHFPAKGAVFEAVLRKASKALAIEVNAKAVHAPDVLGMLA
jgi:AcrR family transcriptional regulator